MIYKNVNKNILELVTLLIENKMPFALQYEKKKKTVFWVPNKYITYVKCQIKQQNDGSFGFLSNFTIPKIIPDGLTLEKAFEMAKEHYNHEEGDDL